MAQIAKRFASASVANTRTTYGTVGAGKKWLIRNIHIANSDTTARTVTLWLAGRYFLSTTTIPANSVYDWSGLAVVDATELIEAQASTAGVLELSISGVEVDV